VHVPSLKLSLVVFSYLLVGGAACGPTSSQPGSSTGGTAAPGTGGAGTGGAQAGTGGTSAGTGGAAQATGGSGTGGNGSGGSGTGGSASGGSGSGGSAGSGGMSNGGGGVNGTGGGGPGASGGRGGNGQAGTVGSAGNGGVPTHQEFILYDDAGGRLLYVNNAKPTANWTSNSGTGRDMQLIGGGRVMLGKSDGWDEYQLTDGLKVGGVHGFSGTQTAHRLADGNTILASVSGTNIVLKFVNAAGQMQRQITYAGFSYVRMVRPTSTGTYLVTADTVAFEGNDQGMVLSRGTISGGSHTWKAMRLANGNIAVTNGYGAALLIYDNTWKMIQTIGGKSQPNAAQLAPWFFADFHVMPNGNFFVVNSQADRTMDNSVQLLEYNAAGTLVWQQKQPTGIHSLEEAIVLDGLDTSKLHVEPEGRLIPAP
jgi:hypothetical protein